MTGPSYDPDKASFSQHVLDAICTFSFDERLVMNCVNTLYETRYSNFVGICPKSKGKGYSICKYINWTDIPGSICIKNKYKQHLHSYLSGAQFYNLTRFNGTVLFVLIITITTLWKTKSMCCFTARNMTFVGKSILLGY